MSRKSRNSEFERKSGKNRRSNAENGRGKGHESNEDVRKTTPRRARGLHKVTATSTPRSPKARQNKERAAHSGRRQGRISGAGREGGALWIYGHHAVMAVLNNPKRTLHNFMMTESVHGRLAATLPRSAPLPTLVLPNVMDKQFPPGTVHQGIAVKVAPLEWPDISDIADAPGDKGLILVLDQITDPHNVGAMLRLCSAFGVRALVMQDRKAPPLGGATAKVAVGCLETIPVCLVKNIGNTLQNLKKQNWSITGLAGETELSLSTALKGGGKRVIVMGAEGPGLRPRVRDCCDQLAKIPMMSSSAPGQAESLNVATAAGIALYEARRD